MTAFGGASCATQGVDYVTNSGAFSFNPGATTFTIPVKVCGDTSAEANESFRVLLANATGATFFNNVGVGTIGDDDILELVLEESGPSPTQAAALDAILAVRDPFRVVGIPEWFSSGVDRNTRVVLFARNLQLNPGETSGAVFVRLVASNNQVFEIPAQNFRAVPNSEFMQVVFRLPDNLSAGTAMVFVRSHGRISNVGTIHIAP